MKQSIRARRMSACLGCTTHSWAQRISNSGTTTTAAASAVPPTELNSRVLSKTTNNCCSSARACVDHKEWWVITIVHISFFWTPFRVCKRNVNRKKVNLYTHKKWLHSTHDEPWVEKLAITVKRGVNTNNQINYGAAIFDHTISYICSFLCRMNQRKFAAATGH